MATSQLVTDYVGRGLLSARPVSPNIGSAGSAWYLATDTNQAFAWNGTAWLPVGMLFPTLSPSTLTTVGAGTMTAADLASAVIVRSGPTSAFADTTDTATAILAALAGAVVGTSFRCRYINTTAYAATIAAGTGVTLQGSPTVAAGDAVDFLGWVTNIGTPAVTLSIA